MNSHKKKKKEPMRTLNWFTEKPGRWTWWRSVGRIGIRTRNLMSLWRGLMSLCMIWLNCLFCNFVCLFVCRFGCFYWGVCAYQNVCRCVCFYSWGLCSPRVSLSSYYPRKDAFFKNSPIFVLNNPYPSSPLFPLPLRPPSPQRAAFTKSCRIIHKGGWNQRTTNCRNNLHQLLALIAPLPLTHPAGDWGARHLADALEF